MGTDLRALINMKRQTSDLTDADRNSEKLPEQDEHTEAPKLTLDRMMTFTLAGRGSVEETIYEWEPTPCRPQKKKTIETKIMKGKKQVTVTKEVDDIADFCPWLCTYLSHGPGYCSAWACKWLPHYCGNDGNWCAFAILSLYGFYVGWMAYMLAAGTGYENAVNNMVMILFMVVFVVSVILTAIGVATFVKNNETLRREEESRVAREL